MRARDILAAASLTLAAAGCTTPCGSYIIQTDLVYWGQPMPISLDRDDLIEVCGGRHGAWGATDAVGDARSFVAFDPSHEDRYIAYAASGVTMEVWFPDADLAPGTTVAIDQGGAGVIAYDGVKAYAPFAEGTLEVRDVSEPRCRRGERVQDFVMRWDLLWQDVGQLDEERDGMERPKDDDEEEVEGNPDIWYRAVGEDVVRMGLRGDC